MLFFQRNGFRVWDWYTRNSMIQWRPNDSQGLRFGFRWIGAIPGEPTLAERNTVVSIQNKHLKVADFFQKVEVTDPRHHRLMVCSWFRPIYILTYIYTHTYIFSYMSMYDTCRWACQPRFGDPDLFLLRLVIKSHWCQGMIHPVLASISAMRIIQTQPWIKSTKIRSRCLFLQTKPLESQQKNKQAELSMEWFRATSTGNHRFYP